VRQPVTDLLHLEGMQTSYDQTRVPGAPAGVYTITATFSNSSSSGMVKPYFEVTTLTGGNGVLNAECGEGHVGGFVVVPDEALGDGTLTPGESFVVEFEIGLKRRRPFDFFVDAFAIVP
jgi:hypothetical protein